MAGDSNDISGWFYDDTVYLGDGNDVLHLRGDITEIDSIYSQADATLPYIHLDSRSDGDNWAYQGAYITLGESTTGALHMTYVGSGFGYIGSGALSSGIPGASYLRFDYDSSNIYTPDNLTVGGTVSGASFSGAGTGLTGTASSLTAGNSQLLDGYNTSVSASNSTVVVRHSSGYIFANYFNTTPNDVTSGVTKVLVETGNGRLYASRNSRCHCKFSCCGGWFGIRPDADLLDGLNSSQFLRSDTNDNLTAAIIVPTANRDEGIFGTYDSYKHPACLVNGYGLPKQRERQYFRAIFTGWLIITQITLPTAPWPAGTR